MNFSGKVQRRYEDKINRRSCLKLLALTATANIFPLPVFSATRAPFPSKKSLNLYNIHTDERLRIVYWYKGKYLPEALHEINYILRDFRANEIKPIDTRLLDFIYNIRMQLNTRQYFHIISGYRCPSTNALLRKKSKGVAKNSLHMSGKAVDIRVPKRDISMVRRAAMNLQYGGVGYYQSLNFVHIDVGEVRYW
jgi:uncharacterized protein YcbK (DUF882 family)